MIFSDSNSIMNKNAEEFTMQSVKILKIQLNGIIDCITKCTKEPSISNILNELRASLESADYDILIYCCNETTNWYNDHIGLILDNRFVHNKEEHKNNRDLLQNILSDLKTYEKDYRQLFDNLTTSTTSLTLTENTLTLIIDRFDEVVRQLRDRYNDRETLDVTDEYDVQDLLHAILCIYCDDIRAEEWTPSYAGTSSQQDFLLKKEKIVIETKKTRKGLGNRELADELIIDKERYKSHPNCKKLICFVYDPEHRIKNPRGFEEDLPLVNDGFEVKIYIRP